MANDERFICIHGHFYQPPREDPWLEAIEVQDSAYPAHDWNERVHMECYAPNTASRILDGQGRIAEIVENYSKISFNFGPTLLSWMADYDPDTYGRILESDRKSREARGGHGNAVAQVYNHVIMPLATDRDKVTQVVWGIRDFQKRFGRMPEGMWLSETAVDSQSLEILAEMGIKFTILSPQQAGAVRSLEDPLAPWQDVSGGRIDPSRPYRWVSDSGLCLDIFFYDGPISQAIAFQGLLNNGEYFSGRLTHGFSEARNRPQMVHVATDGESYGHHHRFGDMALAYALRKIEKDGSPRLTNYGEFLEKYPPDFEVHIVERSSWSCLHGIERWRSDCGCRIGAQSNWNQTWRGPMRESLNWLRDRLDGVFATKGAEYFRDPWQARNNYIDVMFDRSDESVKNFFAQNQSRELDPTEQAQALKLLEMQRHGQFMFTSCGWFFDELSGIEGVTVLRFAGRALQLAEEFSDKPLEDEFLAHLAKAKSNIPEFGDGRRVFQRFVKPGTTDLHRVAAHVAMAGLVDDGPDEGKIYCYSYKYLDRKKVARPGSAFSAGRLRVVSDITREILEWDYLSLHLGGHDFRAGLKPADGPSAPSVDQLLQKFQDGSLDDLIVSLEKDYGPRIYSLQDMLLETRRNVLGRIIREMVGRYDGTYRQLVDENRKLISYLRDFNFPIPDAFRLALQYVLNRDFEDGVARFDGRLESIERLSLVRDEARKFGVNLDEHLAADMVRRRVNNLLIDLSKDLELATAQKILAYLDLAARLELNLFLWHAENLFYRLWNERLRNSPAMMGGAGEIFRQLAQRFRQVVTA